MPNVAPKHQVKEAEYVFEICRKGDTQMVAGVIGGDFLNRHDHHLDFSSGLYEAGDGWVSSGHEHALEFPVQLQGLPTLKARIGEDESGASVG